MCRGRRYVGSLYLPLNCAVNLKLLLKSKHFLKNQRAGMMQLREESKYWHQLCEITVPGGLVVPTFFTQLFIMTITTIMEATTWQALSTDFYKTSKISLFLLFTGTLPFLPVYRRKQPGNNKTRSREVK